MKKYLALTLAVLMALTCVALVACGDPCKDGHNFVEGVCTRCEAADPDYTPEGGETGAGNVYVDEEFVGTSIVGTGKVYLTTVGQADFDYAETLLTDAVIGAGYTGATINNLLEASDVEAGSTVIMVVGYTAKGIAPGITISGETARAEAFAAKAGEINLIVLHLGGQGRRGDGTDPMVRAIVGAADYTFIYHDVAAPELGGDFDGLFTSLNQSELYMYADETEIAPALKVLLGVE